MSPPIYSKPQDPFPENPEEALALDPLPPSVAGRKVIISQTSKPATTTGDGGGLYKWNLTFRQQVSDVVVAMGGGYMVGVLQVKAVALGVVVVGGGRDGGWWGGLSK